jgi:hypothetical protein
MKLLDERLSPTPADIESSWSKKVPSNSSVMTYVNSPFRCISSDIPSAGAWESGNVWISVNACSLRLSRPRPEWPPIS